MTEVETKGNILAGGSLALVAGGLLGVDGLMIALGLAGFAALGLAWALSKWSVRDIAVSVDAPAAGEAGDRMRIRVLVTNRRRWLDLFGGRFTLVFPGGALIRFGSSWVVAGTSAEANLKVVLATRGAGTVIAKYVSSFPFGLFKTEVKVSTGHEMVVVPRPVTPVELLTGGGAQEVDSQHAMVRVGDSGDLKGLRDYRAGDRGNSLAWPASARSLGRGGGLVVKELDPPGFNPRRVVVLFHSYASDNSLIRPDRFERSLGLLLGALSYFQGRGIQVTLLADFEEWIPLPVVNRLNLAGVGKRLARVRRNRGTELHEVQARLCDISRYDGIIVISDMELSSWEDRLGLGKDIKPKVGGETLVVDIRQAERRKSRA